ncbi:MAG: DNA gyrase subunit B [Christensenellaceae bacterium]|nr:DNA gyrase subunit B [Christensenellaceae bacterium]
MGKSYDAKDIVVLEGLAAVRLRPGMYIGGTGSKGVHHILWEIVDNSMDEIANGHGNQISVTLHKDGSATVEDDGRGIPVDPHPTLKISGAEVVFTQLHAGGKFDSSNYSYSGGLHGVGASVTNALSSWLKATVYRNKKIYEIDFASVADANGNVKGGVVQNPLHEVGVCPANKTGTRVTFMPDPTIFMNSVLNSDTIRRRLRELAFLNKGVEINFIDEKEGQTHNYKFDGGLADFVEYLNESKTTLFRPAVSIEGEAQGIKLSAALQYTDSYAETVISYVNNIPTSEGGTHEVGFKTALTKVMNDCARKLGFLKDKELNLMGEDFREGITLIFAIKMQNIQFEGQTKTKLGNPEVKAKVEVIVNNELPKAFESKEGQKIFEQIIEKAKGAARVRLAAKKAKEVARQKNSIESSSLIGKLANCSSRKPEQNELFIVEGDSAGGSAKQARDRSFQAILPLKGKPLNAEKKRLDQVLANEEIRTIIAALGTGVGEDFDIDYLKYHKIIILSDADQDGAHIRAILLTFFYRYMKELLYNGNIYIGLPPLYKVSKKDTIEYVYSDKELPEATERVGRGYAIQRYKGLGEMNPDQLWETTMDPSRRTLVRVGVDDAANAEEMVTVLMGDDIESRKEYISTYVNFNKVDMLSKIVEK